MCNSFADTCSNSIRFPFRCLGAAYPVISGSELHGPRPPGQEAKPPSSGLTRCLIFHPTLAKGQELNRLTCHTMSGPKFSGFASFMGFSASHPPTSALNHMEEQPTGGLLLLRLLGTYAVRDGMEWDGMRWVGLGHGSTGIHS